MEHKLTDKLEQLADYLDKQLDNAKETAIVREIKEKLSELCDSLNKNQSVNITVDLKLYDNSLEKELLLHQVGLSADNTGKPYIFSGVETLHQYWVNGDIEKIPHHICPNCWGDWDFKQENPICPDCGIQLGNEVKIFLDDNTCPHCENGKVSIHNSVCNECGHEINPKFYTWG